MDPVSSLQLRQGYPVNKTHDGVRGVILPLLGYIFLFFFLRFLGFASGDSRSRMGGSDVVTTDYDLYLQFILCHNMLLSRKQPWGELGLVRSTCNLVHGVTR